MPRTRQQRRAHARRPRAPRRYGSRIFATMMVLLVVGGLGFAYFLRENPPPITRGAIVGEHWHASYRIYICGKRVTNYPTLEGEIHSHGDGFMHIHPATQPFANENANVGVFLRHYETLIGSQPNGKRMLVFPDGTRYEDGDECPDGKKYNLEVLNKGEEIEGDPAAFTPHEGDQIVIRFGPEGDETIPNPYAKAKGLPDPGLGPDRPENDTGLPQPSLPATSPGASPSPPPGDAAP